MAGTAMKRFQGRKVYAPFVYIMHIFDANNNRILLPGDEIDYYAWNPDEDEDKAIRHGKKVAKKHNGNLVCVTVEGHNPIFNGGRSWSNTVIYGSKTW